MKKIAATTSITALVVSFTVAAYAQEAEWEKLMGRSRALYQQGKYWMILELQLG